MMSVPKGLQNKIDKLSKKELKLFYRNVNLWFSILKEDENWDYNYLLKIINHKLILMKKYFIEKGHRDEKEIKTITKKITIVIEYIKRFLNIYDYSKPLVNDNDYNLHCVISVPENNTIVLDDNTESAVFEYDYEYFYMIISDNPDNIIGFIHKSLVNETDYKDILIDKYPYFWLTEVKKNGKIINDTIKIPYKNSIEILFDTKKSKVRISFNKMFFNMNNYLITEEENQLDIIWDSLFEHIKKYGRNWWD